MAHDVFISHSSKDKPVADAICTNLEIAGIRCWIAPRDIAPGEDWPTAITNAIAQSRIMVLIFSASSNSSEDVSRELFLASNNKLIIIPFKIEDIEPEPGKQYYLARTHWLDAMYPPTQEQITMLVQRVKSILSAINPDFPKQVEPVRELQPPAVRPAPNQKSRRILLYVMAGVLVVLGIFASFVYAGRLNRPQATSTPTQIPITPSSTPTQIPTMPSSTPTQIPTMPSSYVIPVQKCAPNCTYKDMVVGFIQTGPEGAWRTANNASFDEAATQLGITMKTYDAQGMSANQISAFGTFTQDPTVNVIILAADGVNGFDDVLKAAQAAGKIVILEDRSINSDASLYYTRIGSDFVHEGQEGAAAMCTLLQNMKGKNVVEISGSGVSAGIDRDTGFRQKMTDCGITITASQNGNWATADSKAVTEAWLKDPTLKNFQGVFAVNDEEALGAIQAIQEAGLTPGKDVQVIGFDATKDGFAALINGTLGADIECNPLLGTQVFAAALKGLNGDATMPSFTPSQEGEFFAAQGAAALNAILPTRKY